MSSDTQKTKTDPAPKNEAAAKSTPGEDVSKAEGGETTAAPSNYSRGEGQKPVTAAYRENWNAIFGEEEREEEEKSIIPAAEHCPFLAARFELGICVGSTCSPRIREMSAVIASCSRDRQAVPHHGHTGKTSAKTQPLLQTPKQVAIL